MKLANKMPVQPAAAPAQTPSLKNGSPRAFLSGEMLKWLAIVTMLIDHIGACLIEGGILNLRDPANAVLINVSETSRHWYMIDLALRLVGRISFPLFCFLLVEGFIHTRNIRRYLLRIGIFAILAEVPFDLAVGGRVFEPAYQNVMWTLLLSLCALIPLQEIDKRTISAKTAQQNGAFAGLKSLFGKNNAAASGGTRKNASSDNAASASATSSGSSARLTSAKRLSLYEQMNVSRAAQASGMTAAEYEREQEKRRRAEAAEQEKLEKEKRAREEKEQLTAAEADPSDPSFVNHMAADQTVSAVKASLKASGAGDSASANSTADLASETVSVKQPVQKQFAIWQAWLLRALVISVFCVIALFVKSDYSFFGVALTAFLYLLRADRMMQCAVGAFSCSWEPSAMLAFVPVYFYNGKRGKHADALRYAFYAFYPVHLLILGLIRVYFIKPLV